MLKYPILNNTQQLVADDLNAGWKLAGVADDEVRASLHKVFVEGTTRQGYITPWKEGPVVLPNGASGQLKVNPFQMYRSPGGATSNAGLEAASGGSETIKDLESAFFPGGTFTITTCPAGPNQHRWDLVYAIFSEADSDSASRLTKAATAGATVVTQTLNTRHKGTVTLAAVQGTVAATSTDPYPAASFPVLPATPSGQAFVPLAYVHVFDSATPATVTYAIDYIVNAPRLAKQNPSAGGTAIYSGSAGQASTAGASVPLNDVKSAVTAVAGQWTTVPGGAKPPWHMEPFLGEVKMWIPLFLNDTPFSGSFAVLPNPIATPASGDAIRPRCPIDWRNRWFRAEIFWFSPGKLWAHDLNAVFGDREYPTSYIDGLGGSVPGVISCGNSFHANEDLDGQASYGTLSTHSYRLASWWQSVTGDGGDNLALLVNATTGALHLGGIHASSLNGGNGLIYLTATDQLGAYQ